MLLFSSTIFEDVGLSNPEVFTLIMGFFALLGALYVIFFGNKLGRVKSFIIGLGF